MGARWVGESRKKSASRDLRREERKNQTKRGEGCKNGDRDGQGEVAKESHELLAREWFGVLLKAGLWQVLL